MRLVVSVDPLPQEGLNDWLLALAEANGYPNPSRLPHLCGVRSVAPGQAEALADRLSEFSGADRAAVSSMLLGDPVLPLGAIRGVTSKVSLTGSLSHGRARSCPRCLAEGNVLHGAWAMAPWIACPLHGCYMTTACHRCGTAFTYLRPGVDRCANRGCDARPSDAEPCPAPGAVVALLKLLGAYVGREDLVCTSALHGVLGLPHREHVLRAIPVLGTSPAAMGKARIATYADPITVVENCATALDDWPRGFHTYLDGLCAGDTNRIREIFPVIYHFLAPRPGNPTDPLRSVLGEEFVRYVQAGPRCSTAAMQGRLLGRKTHPASLWVSKHAAMKSLRVCNDLTERLLRNGELTAVPAAENSQRWLLARKDVDRLVGDLNLGVSRDDFRDHAGLSSQCAAQRLGLGRAQITALKDAGLLRAARRGLEAYLSRESVEDLLSTFFALPVRQGRSGDDLCDISGAAQIAKGYGIAELVAGMTSGAIEIAGIVPDAPGLARYLFSRQAIRKYIRDDWSTRGYLDRRSATARIRCAPMDLPRLIAAGLIGVAIEKGCRTDKSTFQINARTCDLFIQRYASTPVVAAEYRTRSHLIEPRLRSLGVTPVLEAAGPSTVAVWLRDHVIDALGTPLKPDAKWSRETKGLRKHRGRKRPSAGSLDPQLADGG